MPRYRDVPILPTNDDPIIPIDEEPPPLMPLEVYNSMRNQRPPEYEEEVPERREDSSQNVPNVVPRRRIALPMPAPDFSGRNFIIPRYRDVQLLSTNDDPIIPINVEPPPPPPPMPIDGYPIRSQRPPEYVEEVPEPREGSSQNVPNDEMEQRIAYSMPNAVFSSTDDYDMDDVPSETLPQSPSILCLSDETPGDALTQFQSQRSSQPYVPGIDDCECRFHRAKGCRPKDDFDDPELASPKRKIPKRDDDKKEDPDDNAGGSSQ